ncbi:MAG: hypothetical protein V3V21_07180 [Thermoplasmata archaeon]
MKNNASTDYREASSNVARTVKEEEKAPRLPRLGSSLGWLQGLFHRGLGLGVLVKLPLLILGILQDGRGRYSSGKRGSERPKLSNLENQKWLIRQRDVSGRLKFIETLDHPPTRRELARHGHGSFSILTTKPALKHWETVVIPEKEDETPQSRTPSAFSSKALITPRRGLRDGTKKKEVHRQEAPKVHAKRPAEEDKTGHVGETSSLKAHSSLRSKSIRFHDEETSPQEAGVRSTVQDESESGRLCERCREPSKSLARCDFCGKTLCDDYGRSCYRDHICPESKVCCNCDRRVENSLVELGSYCNKTFCSPRCRDVCRRENKRTDECRTCVTNALIENAERSTSREAERTAEEEDERSYEDDGTDEQPEEESTVDVEYVEEEIDGEEDLDDENEDSEEEDEATEVEETCEGVSKKIACKKCFKSHCVSRYCDGICKGCRFFLCDERCRRFGRCKTCPYFDDCEIRCRLTLERCDTRYCRGFSCEDRCVSGVDCDRDCERCDEPGCYFYDESEDEDHDDEE